MEASEVCIFAVSMDSSMMCIFPRPIDIEDDYWKEKTIGRESIFDKNNNGDKIFKENVLGEHSTGWETCSGLIETIISSCLQYHVDITFIKYFAEDADVFHGNTDALLSSIMSDVRKLNRNSETTGPAAVHLAVEEIKTALEQKKYTTKTVHWFIDAVSFANSKWSDYESLLLDTEFHLHIIGSFSDLLGSYMNVQSIRKEFIKKKNAELHFLFSVKDVLNDNDIWMRKIGKIENIAIPVDISMAQFSCSILLRGYVSNGKEWGVKNIEVVGFVGNLTLSETLSEDWRISEKNAYHIDFNKEKSGAKPSNGDFLWSLATYLAEAKPGTSCICQCSVSKMNYKKKTEFCLLVPVQGETDSEVGLMIMRLRNKYIRKWKQLLKLELVESVDEKIPPVTNTMYKKAAPCEKKFINQRLDALTKVIGEKEVFEQELNILKIEYQLVGLLKPFIRIFEHWKKKYPQVNQKLQ